MNLYLVQFDGQSWYVEAPNFAAAIEAWKKRVEVEWGSDYDGTEQPCSVALVQDEPVVRQAAATDRHVEEIIRKHRERAAKGLAKYGTTLERKDLSLSQWLTHLQEELMDAAAYAERALAEPAGALPVADGAFEFLKRAADGEHRIVSSGDLTEIQIAEAQACGRFYVEPGGGLGWALLPWSLTTTKDRDREALYLVGKPATGGPA